MTAFPDYGRIRYKKGYSSSNRAPEYDRQYEHKQSQFRPRGSETLREGFPFAVNEAGTA